MGELESAAKPTQGKLVPGMILVCLFALPFGAFGTFAAFKSIDFFLTPGKAGEGLMMGLFALPFSIVGFGLFGWAIVGYRSERRKQERRVAHPDEPWLWREDWAQGKSCASARKAMWIAWISAAFWNGVSSVVALGMWKGHESLLPLIIFGTIFPIIGLVLIGWAVRVTIAWKKFGPSTFKMLAVPVVIGGNLSGAIETSVKVRPQDGFHLRLACVNRVRVSTGKNTTTKETILWKTEKTVNEDLLDERGRSGIPVSFPIPVDAAPTDETTPANTIVWRLIAKAKVPGVDYSASFDVPVFRMPVTAAILSNE